MTNAAFLRDKGEQKRGGTPHTPVYAKRLATSNMDTSGGWDASVRDDADASHTTGQTPSTDPRASGRTMDEQGIDPSNTQNASAQSRGNTSSTTPHTPPEVNDGASSTNPNTLHTPPNSGNGSSSNGASNTNPSPYTGNKSSAGNSNNNHASTSTNTNPPATNNNASSPTSSVTALAALIEVVAKLVIISMGKQKQPDGTYQTTGINAPDIKASSTAETSAKYDHAAYQVRANKLADITNSQSDAASIREINIAT